MGFLHVLNSFCGWSSRWVLRLHSGRRCEVFSFAAWSNTADHERHQDTSMNGSKVPFESPFFPNPLWNSIASIAVWNPFLKCQCQCVEVDQFPIKKKQCTKINQFPLAFGWRFTHPASTAAATFGFPCCGCRGNVERSPTQSPEKCTNPWATGLPCGSSLSWWCILKWKVVLNCTYCWKQWTWIMFRFELKNFPHRVPTCSNHLLVGAFPVEMVMTRNPGFGGRTAWPEMMV